MKNLWKEFKQGAKMGSNAFISYTFDPIKAMKSIEWRATAATVANRVANSAKK